MVFRSFSTYPQQSVRLLDALEYPDERLRSRYGGSIESDRCISGNALSIKCRWFRGAHIDLIGIRNHGWIWITGGWYPIRQCKISLWCPRSDFGMEGRYELPGGGIHKLPILKQTRGAHIVWCPHCNGMGVTILKH